MFFFRIDWQVAECSESGQIVFMTLLLSDTFALPAAWQWQLDQSCSLWGAPTPKSFIHQSSSLAGQAVVKAIVCHDVRVSNRCVVAACWKHPMICTVGSTP